MVSIISIFFSVPSWHYGQLTKIKRSRNFFTRKTYFKMSYILFQLLGWLDNEVILKFSDYFTVCVQYFLSELPVALSGKEVLVSVIRNTCTNLVMCMCFWLCITKCTSVSIGWLDLYHHRLWVWSADFLELYLNQSAFCKFSSSKQDEWIIFRRHFKNK